jgi:hypothetical protein
VQTKPLAQLAIGIGVGTFLCLPLLILVPLASSAMSHDPVGVLVTYLPLVGLGVIVTVAIVLRRFGWVALGAALAVIGELATLLALS